MKLYFFRKLFLMLLVICLYFQAKGQNLDSSYIFDQNAANKMLNSSRRLNIGGYAQLDYNQPFGNNEIQNGNLDVHRLVLLFGYNFTNKLSFVTEIELEHVVEVYVEQAFVNYSLNTYFNFRGGLLLIPMGIINEHHEPTTFNGVERPLIDTYIVPTTWRELGLGIAGTIPEVSMRYQAYIVNGLASYNGQALLSGSSGLRKGRQKGAESFIRFPNFSARAEYYGVLGLNLGLSGFFGKTESTLYDDVNRDNETEIAVADSSVVGVSMGGFDVRYQRKGVQLRGQVYYITLSNTGEYNFLSVSDNVPNNVGSSLFGYYIEASYNVFQPLRKVKSELIPFIRFSNYDTQYSVVNGISKNKAFAKTVITTGIGWKLHPGVMLKADFQFIKPQTANNFDNFFNAGIAVWF